MSGTQQHKLCNELHVYRRSRFQSFQLLLQLHKRGVPNAQVHDCFWVWIGQGQILKEEMGDACAQLFGEATGNERPIDLFAKSIGLPHIVSLIRRSTDDEDYFDPAILAGGTAANFIC